jgi:hypothetical protein
MAFQVADRVKETTTTTGTGTLNLDGAVAGFQTFVAGIGNGNETYYVITDPNTGDYEVGVGTITDAATDTLSRDSVITSSNAGSLVNFGAGTKDVFCSLPSERAVIIDDASNVEVTANITATSFDGSGAALTSLNASNVSSGTLDNARLDAQLQDIAGLATTSGKIIQGDGANFVLSSYTIPTSDGTTGQVLTTNGSGAVTFQTPTVGDITAVTAGSGLTGGGTTGDVTLNVGAGTGVTVNADDIAIGQDVATSASPTFAGLTVDTDTLYVDSTNNRVGVGTSSPDVTFQVIHDTSSARIGRNTSQYFELSGDAGSNYLRATGKIMRIGTSSVNDFALETNNQERMRISSSEIALNDQSNDQDFRVESNNNTHALFVDGGNDMLTIGGTGEGQADCFTFNYGDVGGAYLNFNMDGRASPVTGVNGAYIYSGQGSTGDYLAGNLILQSRSNNNRSIQFVTGSTPALRMTIDSSGNVLVGKTSTDLGATAGIELNGQYDVGYFTRSAEKALVVNRLSTDGTIADFRKDGTTVGSIGTLNSDLYIGTGDTTLSFIDGTNSINPTGTSGAQRSDLVSLGDINNRFKDAHFSGVVNATRIDSGVNSNFDDNLNVNATGGLGFVQGSIKISSSTIDGPSGRGQGVFMFNEGYDQTYYAGTLYGNQAYGIGSVSSISLDTSAANRANSYVEINYGTSGTVFNENSVDRDFRVESNNNAHMLFVDGGADSVGINTNSTQSTLYVNNDRTDREGFRVIQSTNGRTTAGKALALIYDDLATSTQPALQVQQNGTGEIIIAKDGATTAFVIKDGGNVGIGTTSPDARFHTEASFSNSLIEEIGRFSRIGGTTAYGSARNGVIAFEDQSNPTLTGAIGGRRENPGGNYNSGLSFWIAGLTGSPITSVSGLTEGMRLNANNNLEVFGGAVFNENSGDYDFRVESDSNTHALFVDANTNNVLIGTTDNSPAESSANDGIRLGTNGGTQIGTNGLTVLTLNRNTSDGIHIDIRRQGSRIGYIGTNTSNLGLGTGDVGLLFDDALDTIFPVDPDASLGIRNGAIDLGSSSAKFKDAHFSGTVTANAFSGDGSALTNVPAGVSDVNMVVVTTTSTYTPTSGTKFFLVYCTGAGGGGGGSRQDDGSGRVAGGAGGGGGTAIRVYDATEMGATAAITIGSGGTGSAGFSAADGGTGGNTTFNPAGTGTTLTGNGGGGGACARSSGITVGFSGTGGSASGGDVNVKGQMGAASIDSVVTSSTGGTGTNIQASQGGNSFWGGGATRLVQTLAGSTNGNNGSQGGGGTGSAASNNDTERTGGTGGNGIVVIMEYQ